MATKTQQSSGGKYFAVFVALTLAMLAGGGWFYHVRIRFLRETVENRLSAVARSKLHELVTWRNERVGDALGLTEDPFFVALVDRWQRTHAPEAAAEIAARFKGLWRSGHYADVELVNAEGRKLLGMSASEMPLGDEEMRSLHLAEKEDRAVLSDIYRHKDDPLIHTAVVAPVRMGNGESRKWLGALVLVVDADDFLYPLIQSWPTASRSAETLLVARHGDDVVFLNDLRHQKGTALTLRIPLTQTKVPAVAAVMGWEGVFEGTDYRGVPVLSYTGPVPDSPWFMVAKMDSAEAFETVRFASAMMLALMAVAVVAMLGFGTAFWLRAQKYQLAYEAEVEQRQIRQALRELDERRRLEIQMKDELLSHVSHELRTPMAVIHQFATILADGLAGETTPDQRRYLEIVLGNVRQLQAMIDDLLESVRAEAGKLVIEPESVVVEALIAEIVGSFAHVAASRQLTLRARVAQNLPPVWAEPRRVRQIIGNLVDNAIKFTPQHGRIEVGATIAEAETGFVRVSVSDTGIGIAKENQPKVFDRLYQVEGSNPVSRKGLGLGLHICKELVEAHGGRIWVESELARGATIHFTLPIQQTEMNHAKTQNSVG